MICKFAEFLLTLPSKICRENYTYDMVVDISKEGGFSRVTHAHGAPQAIICPFESRNVITFQQDKWKKIIGAFADFRRDPEKCVGILVEYMNSDHSSDSHAEPQRAPMGQRWREKIRGCCLRNDSILGKLCMDYILSEFSSSVGLDQNATEALANHLKDYFQKQDGHLLAQTYEMQKRLQSMKDQDGIRALVSVAVRWAIQTRAVKSSEEISVWAEMFYNREGSPIFREKCRKLLQTIFLLEEKAYNYEVLRYIKDLDEVDRELTEAEMYEMMYDTSGDMDKLRLRVMCRVQKEISGLEGSVDSLIQQLLAITGKPTPPATAVEYVPPGGVPEFLKPGFDPRHLPVSYYPDTRFNPETEIKG